jgi:hypothetical protein
VIQGADFNLEGSTLRRRFRALGTGLAVGVFVLALAACSGGGGAGPSSKGGGGGGGAADDTSNLPDDRTLGGTDPNGTGSVPHVVITHELPGGDPALDQAPGSGDLGG